MRTLHLKAGRRIQSRRLHVFYAEGAFAGNTVKMSMMIVVGMHVAMAGAEGILEAVAAVYGLVNETFFLKSFERAIQRDTVRFVQLLFEVFLRKGAFVPEENIQHALPELGFPQLVVGEQLNRIHTHG